MTSIVLDGIYVNRVADPQEYLVFEGFLRPTESFAIEGAEISNYAGGRRRARFSDVTTRVYRVQLTFAPKDDFLTLLSWARQTLELRDLKGRKIFGVFLDLQSEDYGYWAPEENRTIPLEFHEVSYEEAI